MSLANAYKAFRQIYLVVERNNKNISTASVVFNYIMATLCIIALVLFINIKQQI
jgi:hypothetical protein